MKVKETSKLIKMNKKYFLPPIICFFLFVTDQVNGINLFGDDHYAPNSRIINIMPTGNSLTQAADPGYRGYLYHLLDSAKYKFDFVGSKHDGKPTNGVDPDHSGFGGYVIGPNPSSGDDWDPWKHGDLLWHLDKGYKIMSNNADVIVLEIGINDFFNDRDDYDPNKIGADRLDSLIAKMYKLCPDVVMLVSNLTPVKWDANFGNLFNSEIPAIISKYKQMKKNIYPVDLRKGIAWKMNSDISSDQLHPTASGYKKMANLFYSELVPVLDSMMAVEQTGNATLLKESTDLKIYPNPLDNNILTIIIPTLEKNIRVEIFDNLGKILFLETNVTDTEFKLPFTAFNGRGIYQLRVSSETTVHYAKLIVN